MRNEQIGFIGIGNMASAIIQGILSSQKYPAQQILMYNPHTEKMEKFTSQGCVACGSVAEVVERCDTIFLCVKPQMFPGVLAEMKPVVAKKNAEDTLFVSIAAGITYQNIRSALGLPVMVVRAMPNTPLLLGAGATAVSYSDGVPKALFQSICDIFSCCGIVREIREEDMNAIIVVSGSSPAYLYWLASITCDYAEKRGIDRSAALDMFCQTMVGCSKMLQETGKDPQTLMDMVTSKGGTTLALLNSLKGDYFTDVMNASFDACVHRAEELSM